MTYSNGALNEQARSLWSMTGASRRYPQTSIDFIALRVLSSACTASNSAVSMIGGTAISTTSASGLRSRVFQNFVLNRWM